jgi:uncharacterized protein Yka (UPF0111/DUF47 family)
MNFENAVAEVFNKTKDEMAMRETIRSEFRDFRESLRNEFESIMSRFRLENSESRNGNGERELIRKIDELKQEVKSLERTCDSLYKVMRSFK